MLDVRGLRFDVKASKTELKIKKDEGQKHADV